MKGWKEFLVLLTTIRIAHPLSYLEHASYSYPFLFSPSSSSYSSSSSSLFLTFVAKCLFDVQRDARKAGNFAAPAIVLQPKGEDVDLSHQLAVPVCHGRR